MDLTDLLQLIQAPLSLTWKNLVMMGVGGVLIYLAITKDYEPVLLLPIGFGAILTNLPLTGIADPGSRPGGLVQIRRRPPSRERWRGHRSMGLRWSDRLRGKGQLGRVSGGGATARAGGCNGRGIGRFHPKGG